MGEVGTSLATAEALDQTCLHTLYFGGGRPPVYDRSLDPGRRESGKTGADETGRAAFRRPSLPSRASSFYFSTVIVTLLVVVSVVTFDVSVASRSKMPWFSPYAL